MPYSIEALNERYSPVILKNGGVEAIYTKIYSDLCTIYKQNPVWVTLTDVSNSPENVSIRSQVSSPAHSSAPSRHNSFNFNSYEVYPYEELASEENLIALTSSPRSLSASHNSSKNNLSTPSPSSMRQTASWISTFFKLKNNKIGFKEQLLPVTWAELTALNLSKEYYQQALNVYYPHKIHALTRYLTENNPWAARENSETGPSSTLFKAHKRRIVLFFLATQEANEYGSLQNTNPSAYFIDKLSDLARAKNKVDGQDDLQPDVYAFDAEEYLDTRIFEMAVAYRASLDNKKTPTANRSLSPINEPSHAHSAEGLFNRFGQLFQPMLTNVNQHAKMTPLGGKTASKIDPPLRCNITAG